MKVQSLFSIGTLMAKIIIFLIFSIFSYGESVRDKQEILMLKKELNDFYDAKEREYTKKKTEIETENKKIESQKKAAEETLKKNEEVLKNIKGTMITKAAKVYTNMKPKIAADIFNTMIEEGKIDDVFDIVTRLKEQKVTLIMKFLTPKNASTLTVMLKNYKPKDETKEK